MALWPEITPEVAQGPTCCSRDQTRVDHTHVKCLVHCTVSFWSSSPFFSSHYFLFLKDLFLKSLRPFLKHAFNECFNWSTRISKVVHDTVSGVPTPTPISQQCDCSLTGSLPASQPASLAGTFLSLVIAVWLCLSHRPYISTIYWFFWYCQMPLPSALLPPVSCLPLPTTLFDSFLYCPYQHPI